MLCSSTSSTTTTLIDAPVVASRCEAANNDAPNIPAEVDRGPQDIHQRPESMASGEETVPSRPTEIKSVKGFTSKQRSYLLKAGYLTTAELLYTPQNLLEKRFNISRTECSQFYDQVVQECSPALLRGEQSKSVAERLGLTGQNDVHVAQQEYPRWISTGDEGLDILLGGKGVRVGGLLEVAGEASSGKTAFALLMSLRVQLPLAQGGLAGSCAYLSSEGNFPSQRLLGIAESLCASSPTHENGQAEAEESDGSPDSVRRMMDNVQLIHCAEVEALQHAVRYSLPALIESLECATSASTAKKPVKLVIVDSIAAPFRGAEGGDALKPGKDGADGEQQQNKSLSERTRELVEISSLLLRLAKKYQLAVVIINQVSDVFDSRSVSHFDNPSLPDYRSTGLPFEYRSYSGAARFFSGESDESKKSAAFGLSWSNCLTGGRIMLSRTGQRRKRDTNASDGGQGAESAEQQADVDEVGTEEIRRAELVFSPHAERGRIDYVLRQKGLVTISDREQRARRGHDNDNVGQTRKNRAMHGGQRPRAIAHRSSQVPLPTALKAHVNGVSASQTQSSRSLLLPHTASQPRQMPRWSQHAPASTNFVPSSQRDSSDMLDEDEEALWAGYKSETEVADGAASTDTNATSNGSPP